MNLLERSFCHLPGLRGHGEAMLWRRGVLSWADWERTGVGLVSTTKAERVSAGVAECRTALAAGDTQFFLRRLPRPHCVRAVASAGRIGFLDVETDGLGPTSRVTTAVLVTGDIAAAYVRGMNVGTLGDDLVELDLLVTYNGARFDLPVLRRELGRLPTLAHLDLCPVLHAWGQFGGLKAIEQRLGITRPTAAEADGAKAVELWQRFSAAGDSVALQELLHYNAADAGNLRLLLLRAIRWSMDGYPLRLAFPAVEAPRQLMCPSGALVL